MSRMQNLGMQRDIKQRETLARVDDKIRRGKVETARVTDKIMPSMVQQ